jgi:hypothetical protein
VLPRLPPPPPPPLLLLLLLLLQLHFQHTAHLVDLHKILSTAALLRKRTLLTVIFAAHLLSLQATFTGNPGSSLRLVARSISPRVPFALTLLSLLPTPKGLRKMLAMLVAHALGSPGIVAASSWDRTSVNR